MHTYLSAHVRRVSVLRTKRLVPFEMSQQGKRVTAREKRLIEKVRAFFEDEKVNRHAIGKQHVMKRLMRATGFCRSTLTTIHREFTAKDGQIHDSPAKRTRYNRRPLAVNVDDFDRGVIRRTMHEMYEQRKYPTLDTTLAALKDKDAFPGGRSTLFKLLKSMGFRYHERNDKTFLYERRDIIEARHKYLRSVRRLRGEGRPIIYLDETWLNAHAAPERIWYDDEGKGGFKRPSGKGQRLIILHAGKRSEKCK